MAILVLTGTVCLSGGIYGDAVPGLPGGVLSFADQNRLVTLGESGQRDIEDPTAEIGPANHLVESSVLSLRSQKTSNYPVQKRRQLHDDAGNA